MPIYKVASPQSVYGAKFRGFEMSTAVAAAPPHDPHNGVEAKHIQEDNSGQNKDATRGQALPSPEARHGIETAKAPGRRETFIDREVREQLRREAELATLHGLPSKKPFSSAEEHDTSKLNLLVISSTEENGGKHEQHNHAVPNSVGSSKEQVVVEERTVVTLSSNDGGVQRTTTTTTTTTGGGGGGSVKTSKDGNPGGNWILHELQQQATREAELRRHRKDMGWAVEGPEDDGQMDQPGWGYQADLKVGVDLDVVDRGSEERPPSGLPDILVEAPDYKSAPSDGNSSSMGQYSKSPVTMRRHSSKVQPFEDVERIQSEVQMVYEPQNETPIDREIRRQREREDALRLARGLVSRVIDTSPDVEVEVLRPRPVEEGGTTSFSATGLGLSMRKFAESRLRSELEKEKKRELDLLKEGKIIMLSADRTPDAMTFVEVISPEKAELRELSRMRSAERTSVAKEMAWQDATPREMASSKNVASKEMASYGVTSRETTWKAPASQGMTSQDLTPREMAWENKGSKEMASKKVVLVELTPKEHLNPVHVEVRNGHLNGDKVAVETKVDLNSHSQKSETRLAAPRSTERAGKGMKLNTVSPNSYTEEDVQKILLTVAERRIEEEIAETKKRELELRELRKHLVISEHPREPEPEAVRNNAHALSVSSTIETDKSSPHPIGDGHRHDDATEVHVTVASLDTVDFGDDRHQQPPDGQGGSKVGVSRRLALIDQWERGIIQRGD